jgi:hypothetical protein
MTIENAARVAQIVTAAVAVLALLVAYNSVRVQRGIARRRAAIDFFLKTEMDEKVVNKLLAFGKKIDEFKSSASIEEFAKTESCTDIHHCLYIYELMAVGIHNKIFDQRICYEYWRDELNRAYNSAKEIIDYDRMQPGRADTYCDLIRLQKKWTGPHWIWQRWRSRWWPLHF